MCEPSNLSLAQPHSDVPLRQALQFELQVLPLYQIHSQKLRPTASACWQSQPRLACVERGDITHTFSEIGRAWKSSLENRDTPTGGHDPPGPDFYIARGEAADRLPLHMLIFLSPD